MRDQVGETRVGLYLMDKANPHSDENSSQWEIPCAISVPGVTGLLAHVDDGNLLGWGDVVAGGEEKQRWGVLDAVVVQDFTPGSGEGETAAHAGSIAKGFYCR